jgi:membrane protein DedA with SNARE-associated domain
VEHLQHAIIALIDHYGYFGFFIALVLGNLGAPIGTEIVLPVAGALTATGHLSSLWLTILVALAGELAGGSIGYALGRFGGVPLIERYGKYIHFTHDRLLLMHRFFERWGTFAIFICRFLPVLRGIAAIPAGIAEMNLALFYLWTFLGSLIFCSLMILAGNALGTHLAAVLPLFHRGAYLLLGVALVAVVAIVLALRARARPALVGSARDDISVG